MSSRIAVLYGGISTERDISLVTGSAVSSALERLGYEVKKIDAIPPIERALEEYKPELVFICLHGRFGEDGQVQALLERMGLPYTGSGVEASRLAMNKVLSKEVFCQHQIPTPDYTVLQKDDRVRTERISLPVVVKPARSGSTLGVSKADTPEELHRALALAFLEDEYVILEEFIDGPEYTVPILDEDALPIVEITYPGSIFTTRLKYVSEETLYIVNPRLQPEVEESILRSALRAHEALGCRHLSRVDLRVNAEGNPFVLEVNTIPGMTERSLVPKSALYAGIGFDRLCQRLVELALGVRSGEEQILRHQQD